MISCTGTTGATGASGVNAPMLTGCTSINGTAVTVAANDDLVEVVGTASAMVTDSSGATATAIPSGATERRGHARH